MAEADDYGKDDDDDEEVIKQIIEREKHILQSVESEKMLEKINLNKLNDREVTVVKKMMDQKFAKNQLKPGDPGFQYNIEKDFDPEESNDWDKSQSLQSIKPVQQLNESKIGPTITREHAKPAQQPNQPSKIEPPTNQSNEKHEPKPSKNMTMADEEFDIDFDEDFNDDLDDFED